jgi:hypothetical protein
MFLEKNVHMVFGAVCCYMLYFSRRKTNPNAAFLPFHSFLARTMDCLLMKKSLFEHLNKRGIQASF